MIAKALWIGAAIAWAGMFAPWEVFQGLFDNTGVSGFGVAGFDQVRNGFGMNLLVNKPYLFLVPVCTALAALLATRPVARPEFRWIVLALSLAALAACVAFFPNFAQDKNQVLAVVSISWGSGVSIVGCIGALAGAAWALLSSRVEPSLRPAYAAAAAPAVPLYTFAPSNSSALAAPPASTVRRKWLRGKDPRSSRCSRGNGPPNMRNVFRRKVLVPFAGNGSARSVSVSRSHHARCSVPNMRRNFQLAVLATAPMRAWSSRAPSL